MLKRWWKIIMESYKVFYCLLKRLERKMPRKPFVPNNQDIYFTLSCIDLELNSIITFFLWNILSTYHSLHRFVLSHHSKNLDMMCAAVFVRKFICYETRYEKKAQRRWIFSHSCKHVIARSLSLPFACWCCQISRLFRSFTLIYDFHKNQ